MNAVLLKITSSAYDYDVEGHVVIMPSDMVILIIPTLLTAVGD